MPLIILLNQLPINIFVNGFIILWLQSSLLVLTSNSILILVRWHSRGVSLSMKLIGLNCFGNDHLTTRHLNLLPNSKIDRDILETLFVFWFCDILGNAFRTYQSRVDWCPNSCVSNIRLLNLLLNLVIASHFQFRKLISTRTVPWFVPPLKLRTFLPSRTRFFRRWHINHNLNIISILITET